jgi:hypothetical protein
MAEASVIKLKKDELAPYLMLKNGNYLYKIPYRNGFAVLKVYYGSRTWFEYALKTLGNVLVSNQTSFMPQARRRTELECVQLWRSAGFRVFDVYEDVEVVDLPRAGYTVFEYVPGLRYVDYFSDASVPMADKLAEWRRFLPMWHRRHQLALEREEPRLIHENGDLKHVMIWHDERLWFDFEMCFRSRRRVREFVGREILAFLKSLGKCVGAEAWDTFLEETARHYPDRKLLEFTYQFAFKNRNLFLRTARWLDRTLKPRSRKTFAKYNAACKLNEILHAS